MAYDDYEYEGDGETEDGRSERSPVRYCDDCKWLLEALRDSEAELRAAEGPGARLNDETVEAACLDENAFLARISKLKRRRNAMLDVLAKHQQLEHR